MKHISSFHLLTRRLCGQLVLVLAGLLLATAAQAQTTIFNVLPNNLPPPAGWTLDDDPNGNDDIDQGDYYLLEVNSTDQILTASYNLTGYTNVQLTLEVRREAGVNPVNPAVIEVSTDGGANFSPLASATPPNNNTWTATGPYTLSSVSSAVVLRFSNPSLAGRSVRLRNLKLVGVAPVLASIATQGLSGAPFCVTPSAGASVSVPYTVSGTFNAGNTFSAQLSDVGGATFPVTPIVIGSVSSTTAGSIAATIPAGTATGLYRVRVVSSNPGTTGTATAATYQVYSSTTNNVTSLTAAAAFAETTLQWANPAACYDDVLIVGRAGSAVTATPTLASYSANSVFGSGFNFGSGQYVVYRGNGNSVTVTGLTNGTTYFFKVFTRRGTAYSTGTSISVTPVATPSITSVILPRNLVGHAVGVTTHTNRVPYAFRLRLSGLTGGATYRFFNSAVLATDAATDDGAGNPIYARATGNFVRTTTPNLTSAANYGTFTTDAQGAYEGWFVLEPTGNARFETGKQLAMRICLNDGGTGTSVAMRLTTPALVRTLQLGAVAGEATGLTGATLFTSPARQFVVIYDNVAGNGQALAATYVESDGVANNATNSYAGFYANLVEGRAGAWGTIIPNTNASGVQRVELRALADGQLLGCPATDADGTWESGAVTVNPTGGQTPVVLTNLDAPLSCSVFVGFNPQITSDKEGNVGQKTVDIRVTMPRAPAADVRVQISNAGGGTATLGIDYLFSNQSLIFPAVGTYPMTQTVSAQFYGDASVEPSETFNLNMTLITGTATIVNNPGAVTLIDDDFIDEGLIINEVSQGASGVKEYIELLATGNPGTFLDLRGWVIDDNNGIFSGNATGGISSGHIRFNQSCTWERVPVGSLIVLYNAADVNPELPPADATDKDLDYVYVVPVYNGSPCGSTANGAAFYMIGDCNLPSNGNANYADANQGPSWSSQALGVTDGVQIRYPANSGVQPVFRHGLSFSTSASSNVTLVNHPDYPTRGSDALFFFGANDVYSFTQNVSNDYRSVANWTAQVIGSTSPQSPGNPNSQANAEFITSLRYPFIPATTNTSYTCEVRADETRVFLSDGGNLITRLANNTTSNLGNVATQVVLSGPSRNESLPGQPYLLAKQFRITPTVIPAAPSYTITFYITDAELTTFANYVSAQTGRTVTPGALRYKLRLFKASGTTLVSQQTSATNVISTTPSVESFGTGITAYSAAFTSFSTFALGATTEDILPVELTRFTATALPTGAVRLNWATASERNNDHFDVMRSADGREFTVIGSVKGNGTTLTPHTYSSVDGAPARPISYYRLRQIDEDGTPHLSDIVSVRLGTPVAAALDAWPQPVTNELNLRIASPLAGAAQLRLIDLQGRVVLNRPLNVLAGTVQTQLSTTELAHGTYVAEAILPGGEVVRVKVVK